MTEKTPEQRERRREQMKLAWQKFSQKKRRNTFGREGGRFGKLVWFDGDGNKHFQEGADEVMMEAEGEAPWRRRKQGLLLLR